MEEAIDIGGIPRWADPGSSLGSILTSSESSSSQSSASLSWSSLRGSSSSSLFDSSGFLSGEGVSSLVAASFSVWNNKTISRKIYEEAEKWFNFHVWNPKTQLSQFTVWKFEIFAACQILREINSGKLQSLKNCKNSLKSNFRTVKLQILTLQTHINWIHVKSDLQKNCQIFTLCNPVLHKLLMQK